MLRINRMTDYAVVVLGAMVHNRGLTTAPRLAQATALPQPTVQKILKILVRAGLIQSVRGAAGGYALARLPEDITVAEIIQALEGPIALTACVDNAEDDCMIADACPMNGHWNQVNHAIRDALEGLSLADMAAAMGVRALAFQLA